MDNPVSKACGVLVVAYDTLGARVISEQVSALGYEVTAVGTTCDEALQIAASCGAEVVLIEAIRSGDLSGIETGNAIRVRADLPVIYFGGASDSPADFPSDLKCHPMVLTPLRRIAFETAIEEARHQAGLERAMREQAAQISLLEARLQYSEELACMGASAGSVLHDLVNLLHVIGASAQFAIQTTGTPDLVAAQLKEIERSAASARALLGRIKTHARTGGSALARMDLCDVAGQFRAGRSALHGDNLSIEYDLPSASVDVCGDEQQLSDLLGQLVSNAVDAIGAGCGIVKVRVGMARYALSESGVLPPFEPLPDGDYAFIEVSDTGCGMSTEILERVFDPFYSTKNVGLGLGLCLVRGIVKRHGATLLLETQQGHGCTVRVYFPNIQQGRSAIVPTISVSASVDASTSLGVALMIDDEAGLLQLATQTAHESGIHLHTFVDWREALASFEQDSGTVGAIISEISLPGIAFAELVQRLRATNKDVPIIACGGEPVEAIRNRLAGLSVYTYLQKPFELQDLARSLMDCLSMRIPAI